MGQYPDVMIDLETTGTRPETTHIIQIAAVRFNLKTRDVDPNFFDRCLLPVPTRFWSEDTRKWWSTMPDTLNGIWGRMEPAQRVLEDFREWVGHDVPTLWAKPSHFEFPFLSSYFNDLGVPMPFHFRNVNDQNSWIRGRFHPETAPNIEKELPFVGVPHNALHDVLHQIKVVFAAADHHG